MAAKERENCSLHFALQMESGAQVGLRLGYLGLQRVGSRFQHAGQGCRPCLDRHLQCLRSGQLLLSFPTVLFLCDARQVYLGDVSFKEANGLS